MAQDFVFLSSGLVVTYDHAAPVEAGSVLDARQTALLNSLGQRLELGVAFVDPFELSVESTVLYDENKREVMSAMPWHSVVRMSVQRIGLAGEAFRFYGGDSYARYGGAAGSSDSDYVWTFGDGGTGIGPTVSHTYAVPGQYEVTLSVPNCREPGRRRLRVLGDWSEGSTSVLEVRDLGASLQAGGWHATVRLVGNQESVPDRAGVIVYARDFWEESPGVWVEETIGPYPERYDPRLLLFGYVVEGSVSEDAKSHTVTFSVESPRVLLERANLMPMAFWTVNATGGVDGHGHYINDLTGPDVIAHLIAEHTNFAAYHDLVLAQSGTAYYSLGVNRGTVWQNVRDLAQNDLGSIYCDKRGDLYVVPHLNANPGWWGHVGPLLHFSRDNLLEIAVSERMAQAVGQVAVEATTSSGHALSASYGSGSGVWEVVGGLLCDSEERLAIYAERLFRWHNARLRVRLTTGLNHALDLLQEAAVTYQEGALGGNGRGYDFTDKSFVVTEASLQLEGGGCRAAYLLEERVN